MPKQNQPFFSVIIPYYNKKDTIKKSVTSVLEQSFKSFELIIVDDGSTDKFDFKQIDNNSVRVIEQNNKGVSEARNRGILEAKGTYICFLDADDLWYPNHLLTLHEMIYRFPECSYFCTSHCTVTEDGKKVHSSRYLTNRSDDCFVCGDLFHLLNCTSDSVINTNSFCIKKTIMINNSILFEPGVRNGEDSDMWFRIALLYPIAISKVETTEYVKKYSEASKNVKFVDDWVFAKRLNDIKKDVRVKTNVIKSCQFLLDRYYMSGCRYYKSIGDINNAKRLLKNIKFKNNLTFLMTLIYLFIPNSIAKRIEV